MKKSKTIVCAIILAVLMISTMALVPAYATTNLLNAGKLDVEGSSTVYPISQSAQNDFQTWTSTITAPSPAPYTGYSFPFVSTLMTLNNQGSGGGITALEKGTIDISASSKPGYDGGIFATTYPIQNGQTAAGQSSAYTYNTVVNDPEEFAVAQDSVAIIVPASDTWLTQASASQVANLFRVTANGGTTALYPTWGDWASAQSPPVTLPTGVSTQTILHVGREFSSGTFDAFNTFFLKPFGYDMTYSAGSGTTAGVWTTPNYVGETSNQQVLADIQNPSYQYAIAFIGLGFVQNDIAGAPATHPDKLNALNLYNPTTSTYVQPYIANVKGGTYVSNEPSGPVVVIRWLWYFMDGIPSASSPAAVKSLWISFTKSDDAYITDNGYMTINRADMAGATSKNPNTTTGTQTVPDGIVDFNDLVYFASAWIAFYSSAHTLNPYADITGLNGHPDGIIDFNDLVAFANNWIAYYANQ